MNNKKNIKIKKEHILIALAVLALATFLSILAMKNNTPTTPIKDEEQEEKDDKVKQGCPIGQYCAGNEKMNAYDYIISVMSSPQYWGVDNLPIYILDYEEEYSYEKLKKQNGTGWNLIDEKTATFSRGSEGILTINFSDNTADIKTWSDVYSSEKNSTLDQDATKYEFDYNNNTYKYIAPYGNASLNHNYDYSIEINGRVYGPKNEAEFRESGDVFDERFVIKDILLYYESLFEKAGCPLLNQPAGTLESYKKKTIAVPKEETDELIHNIWSQDGFRWDWDKDSSLNWLDNYQDIFNQETGKSSEMDKIELENGGYLEVDTFNPLYLVLVNKEECTKQYTNRNASTGKLILWIDEYFDVEGGAFATYFLKPMTEKLFGHSSVYYFDNTKLPASNVYDFNFNTKEEFLNNLSYPKDASSTTVLTVYKNGDIPVGNIASEGDGCHSMNSLLFREMKIISEHYGVDFPFADDYMLNFYIFYNPSAQRLLGLR